LAATYGIPSVRTFDIKINPDERGSFCEILRQDWKELLDDEWITQANLSYTYPGVVRAWHRHLRGQVDYFLVVQGSLKICVYDDDGDSSTKGGLAEVVLSEDKLQIVRVPGRFWHGTKTLGYKPSLTVYFVNRLYDYKNPDEERRPWNDQSIVPLTINGKSNDPRVGKTWDWHWPVHR
jgi:dTDP-4-dehydrorhamnose 3,5-epimerase